MRAAPGHLTEGGWCQVLANWVVERRPALGRAARLLAGPGLSTRSWCSARWSTPRRTSSCGSRTPVTTATGGDPAEYRRATTPGSPGSRSSGVEAVGFGWVNLRAGGTGRHDLAADWPYDVEQPIAPAIAEWARRRHRTDDVGARRRGWCVREDVTPGDRRPAGAEDPDDDRAPPAARPPARPAGRHRRGRAGRRLRRRAGRSARSSTPLAQLLDRDAGETARDLPAGRARAGARGLPRQRRRVMSAWVKSSPSDTAARRWPWLARRSCSRRGPSRLESLARRSERLSGDCWHARQ